jgi:PAS domain S-box-containing protein
MKPVHVRSTDRRRAAEHAVNRILAASTSLEDAAGKVLEVVGTTLGWDCGAFWRVQRKKLRCVATWQRPDTDLEAFLASTREATFERGSGLPGRVWATGAPEWRPDVRRDGASSPATAEATERVPAGVGFPVSAGGEVLAVMELFGPAEEAPEPEWLEMFEFLGAQVGQFVERHAATRALRESNDRMRAVVDNMLEGLITISDRNLIEQVNPAAEAMFGYDPGELVGQHLKILMPQSLAGRADEFLKDGAQKALGRISEWDGRRKNGEVFRFELSLFAFQTPEGRHFAGHLRDISERKKLEKMKQEFVATVSHELRTPLTSIRGSLSLLAGGALGDLPDEARDVVLIAERNTIRLITLINDILDLERVEAGKVQLKVEEIPLAAVLERSLESVRGFAEQQGIAIAAPATEARVAGDLDRLVQVLVNLLSNAVKFSPPAGTVTVEVAERDDHAEVSVRDNGRGVPAHRREAIFERFEQVESSDARQKACLFQRFSQIDGSLTRTGGTGLGLAICKAMVEQHGGKIGVESQPGRGSRFWFRIPSRRAPVRVEDDAFLTSLSGLRTDARDVLLVDDDTALLGVLTRQLLQAGVPVRAARTAREAIAEARTPPALIVIDVALPDGSGYDVIQALRERPDSSGLPVLIYTAHDLSREDQARLALGPTRMLIKSKATDAEFQAVVLELLRTPEEAGRELRRSS